jgi:hypothetical protein
MPTTLFSIARRERDSSRYWDLVTGVSHEQAVARFAQDGVERKTASDWVDAAQHSVHRYDSAELAVRGDLFEHVEVGPRGESYKLLAVTVYAPNVSAVRT